ncbi:MAG TPA: DUF4032 domain-containing protein [Candidatus Limnocylindrales bacterium]
MPVPSPTPADRPGATFPHLRLRRPTPGLLLLPWARPLEDWREEDLEGSGSRFRELPVGPSRHLVRFVEADAATYALKELPRDVAAREYDVLRRLEQLELPAVAPAGLVDSPERDVAVLVTEYLRHSLQYRRMLMRLPIGANPYRDRLLDAMAWLLVDLHRNGVFWGDCSLANTLFRRDGDRIQAYLVDAETSEVHPSLSDGQRRVDLDVLVENVAFGLADLAAALGRPEDMDDAVGAAESVRARYDALWDELFTEPELTPGDRFAVAARVRRLNELGFAVEEVELRPRGEGRLRLRAAVTNRRFHAHELERLTGIVALENQARLLLNDLGEYRAWLEWHEGRRIAPVEAAARWQREVVRPRLRELTAALGPGRDPLQAYIDVLEHKWLLSERVGRDVGLDAAVRSYLESGAPAPETLPEAEDEIVGEAAAPDAGLAAERGLAADVALAEGGDASGLAR